MASRDARRLPLALCLLQLASVDAFALTQPRAPHVVTVGRPARAADFLGGPAAPPLGAARSAPAVMIDKPLKVGVVGVTGAVGKEVISVLGERGIPLESLRLFASARSAGKEMDTPLGPTMIEEFTLEAARESIVLLQNPPIDGPPSKGSRTDLLPLSGARAPGSIFVGGPSANLSDAFIGEFFAWLHNVPFASLHPTRP